MLYIHTFIIVLIIQCGPLCFPKDIVQFPVGKTMTLMDVHIVEVDRINRISCKTGPWWVFHKAVRKLRATLRTTGDPFLW